MSRRNELKTEILRRLLLYGKATRPELVAPFRFADDTFGFQRVDGFKYCRRAASG